MSRPGLEGLHVLALYTFAVAQPLYDVTGEHAQFFVARGAEAIDIVLFVVGVSLLAPGVLLLALGLSAWIGARPRRACLLGLVAILAACTAIAPLNRLGADAALALAAAAAIGVASAATYARFAAARSFVTALSVGVVAFPAFFVLATPVARLALPGVPAVATLVGGARDDPVIFVVFDLLPTTSLMNARREIDAERFPSFAALAAESTWYRHATTVAPDTARSIPALLTGLRPEPGMLPLAADYPVNLFTLLAPSHALYVSELETRLCPVSLCEPEGVSDRGARLRGLATDTWVVFQHLVVPASWNAALEPISMGWRGFGADESSQPTRRAEMRKVRRAGKWERRGGTLGERRAKFKRFVSGLGAQRAPVLAYLHLGLPHGPFVFLPSGRTYVPSGPSGRGMRRRLLRAGSLARVRLCNQRLTLQVGFADTLLGALIERLRELGLWERALVVVVADHGGSYTESKATRSVNDGGTLFVPLFVKVPGQKQGRIDDRNAETIDLLPTIADALQLELPVDLEGRSLLGRDDRTRHAKRIVRAYRPGTVSHASWTGLLEDSLRRKLRIVGDGPMDAIFRTGAYSELVGRSLDELRRGVQTREGFVTWVPGIGGHARLDQQAYLQKVSPQSMYVPVFLTGELEPDGTASPRDVVVAVNGIVRTTVRTAPGVRGPPLALLLPESSLEPGPNRVELLVAHLAGSDRVELRTAQLEDE